MKSVELIPGKAIGPIQLGQREEDLPRQAKVAHGVGSLDGVHFRIAGGKVDDVWVDDLAGFPHELTSRGKSIPRTATLESLKALFGECTEVEGVLGGVFYNCKAGVTIGCDHQRRPMQLRLKPR